LDFVENVKTKSVSSALGVSADTYPFP
jgi:hypothetical protein